MISKRRGTVKANASGEGRTGSPCFLTPDRKQILLIGSVYHFSALRMSDFSYILLDGSVSLEGPSASLMPEELREAYFGVR